MGIYQSTSHWNPYGKKPAPLIADLFFLMSYERDFMLSLKTDTQAQIIDTFYDTSRYLDDILMLIISNLVIL